MANYTTTITNEGAALLASVIANQGTLTFNEFRFSENDYTGQESTLTEGTFLGVFITASAAASVIDSTTIKASAQFNNSTITGNHDLYSIGIIGTDGNTTALIAVCTTTDPDVIREPLTGTSTYAFNVNLTVSDTSQITVAGTTAAVIYDIDVVDNLISPATDKPLSANQGRVLNENVEAIVDVYGAKQMLPYPYNETTKTENAITFTDNGNGTITVNGIASNDTNFFCRNRITDPMYLKNGTYKFTGCPSGGGSSSYEVDLIYQDSGGSIIYLIDVGNGLEFTVNGSYGDADGANFGVVVTIYNGVDLTTPIIFKPMIYDARITDPTFAPFAETNLQLTRKTSGLSNKNLLDNPWFTVNQRGQTSYPSNAYTVDRWSNNVSTAIESNTVVKTNNGVTINNGANLEVGFSQTLESVSDLSGKTLTLSAKINGTIYSNTFVYDTESAISKAVTPNVTISFIGSIKQVALSITGANTVTNLRAIKLEVGSVSTLHLDVAPDPATELLKCQRYFYRVNQEVATAMFAFVMGLSATVAYAPFRTPVPMRATPSISFGGAFNLVNASDTNVVSTISFSAYTGDLGTLSIGSSNLTPSNMYILTCGLANSYIDFNSEL